METEDHKHFKTWLLTEIVDYRRRSSMEPKLTMQLARRDAMWMRELIEWHHGEVHGPSGDCNSGLMASFEENADAFACALSLQQGFMEALAAAVHPGQVLSHRIGLHFGEVFLVGGVTVGDCLTIAKKLRDRAEANEIILSHATVVMLGGLNDRKPIYEGEKELESVPEPVRIYRLPPVKVEAPPTLVSETSEEAAALGVSTDPEEAPASAASIGITADPNAETAARRVAAMRRAMNIDLDDQALDPNAVMMSPEVEALEPKKKSKPASDSQPGGPTLIGTARFQHLQEARISGHGGYPAVYMAVVLAGEELKAEAAQTDFDKGILGLEFSGWLRKSRIELLFYQSGDAIVVDATGDRENKQQMQTIKKLFASLCDHPTDVSYAQLRGRGFDARGQAPEHRPSARPSPFARK